MIGGGLAGFATALRAQARGASTMVLEAHQFPGGCAGFWRTHGYAFDVGATTFVDFDEDGVGGRFLAEVGLADLPGERLEGYRVLLPDGDVTLWRDRARWHAERLRAFGDDDRHREFWARIDDVERVFWRATRQGARLPLAGPSDVLRGLRVFGRDLPAVRYLRWTVRDALVAHGLGDDRRLRALLDLLLEDTVHAPSSVAPLVNGAMGVNIRGAGLTRFRGGAWGFWRALIRRYRELGGDLRVRCPVTLVEGRRGAYRVTTAGGVVEAGQVVAAVPIEVTARIASTVVGGRLDAAIRRDGPRAGGAAVLFLGVPDAEVADAPLTHHGVYVDYDRPLGDGNNVFVSVSAPGDVDSAPPGRRAVMVSTHTDPAGWHDLSDADYERRKDEIGAALLSAARRVHPQLGRAPGFRSSGTPRTYARFLGRPGGAVGGPRQSLDNTNQRAVPHDVGVPGLYLVGDTTWPGLGTVSVLLGSGVVADALLTS